MLKVRARRGKVCLFARIDPDRIARIRTERDRIAAVNPTAAAFYAERAIFTAFRDLVDEEIGRIQAPDDVDKEIARLESAKQRACGAAALLDALR